jgi:hypothetical protein
MTDPVVMDIHFIFFLRLLAIFHFRRSSSASDWFIFTPDCSRDQQYWQRILPSGLGRLHTEQTT